MIFNSVTYLLFLLTVVLLYWILPRRLRLWTIFISSLVFYGFWRVEFIPVMLFSVVADYIVALKIHSSKKQTARRHLLYVSLIINLGLLFYFKYLLFFADTAVGFITFAGMTVDPFTFNIILPLGISFYTFQTISYTVDVYRGFIKPEEDFVLYACYVTFFPQLVAGPILRSSEVMPQLDRRSKFDMTNIGIGARRILYGLFLKVVLADNIAPLVDSGFAQHVASLSALDVWTLAFLFGFQIYFDFSAYSHIALGSARLMGITFPENFHFPYLAVSPRDFWRRWHISLSSWIRDYLYLPLTGAPVYDRSVGGIDTSVSTQSNKHVSSALFLTWAIMGLWHGANWTFLLWGLHHAVFIYLYRITSPLFSNLSPGVRSYGGWAATLAVTMLGWIPFRAQSVTDVFALYAKVFQPAEYFNMGLRENYYLIAGLILLSIITVYVIKNKLAPFYREHIVLNYCLESAAFVVVTGVVFVFLRPINQFIYFQF